MSASLLLLAALCLPAGARAAQPRCAFPAPPTVVTRTDSGPDKVLLQYWDLDSDSLLTLKSLPDSQRLAAYRALAAQRLATDPRALLKRYAALQPDPDDRRNIEAVQSRPGSIKKARCLEALLLDLQLGRSPRYAAEAPEFIAYFLKRQGTLRVYFLTNDAAGIRGAGFSGLLGRVDADKAAGWEVLANLHNHGFFLDELDSKKPQGVLAPSANDVRVLKAHIERFGLRGAYITNGFDTVYVPSRDIARYAAAK